MAFSRICLSIPTGLLVFIVSTLPIIAFYIGYSVYVYKRKMSRLQRSQAYIAAKVTRITLDEQTWREGWIVQAAWIDEKTRRAYTFSSRPQELHPKQKIGDNVLVMIEGNNPLRYTMEL